jgi:hypothetical protein
MTGLEYAVLGLRQAIDAPRRHHVWRWLVRHRMAAVKEALKSEHAHGGDGWLAARESGLLRERDVLLRRIGELGPQVLEDPDVEGLRRDLLRLLTDLERHRQRLSDLVYDSVSMELGGSE